MTIRVLVIQLRQLGDILLTTPAVSALTAALPGAEIDFLAHAMGKLVLAGNPDIHELHLYEDSWGVAEHLRLARRLRRRRYDLVVDFMANPRSAFYAFASGGAKRLAFRSARRLASTTTIPRPTDDDYIVRHKQRLVDAALTAVGGARAVDMRTFKERPILPWTPADAAGPLAWFREATAVEAAPLRIVLSPTHRRPRRRWDDAKWAALADRLVKDWGAAVIWLWGPGEEADVERAMALTTAPTIKAPRTSFRAMAALVANADFFVATSNGPSHVAVAVDTPSLQLHGHTSARAWCPMTARHRAVKAPTDELGPLPIDVVWKAASEMKAVVVAQAAVRRGRSKARDSWLFQD